MGATFGDVFDCEATGAADAASDDPMGMWRSTQQASGVPRKTTFAPFADETRWYFDNISAFLDCLEQGSEPVMSAARAFGPSKVISAAYRSAASGGVERV